MSALAREYAILYAQYNYLKDENKDLRESLEFATSVCMNTHHGKYHTCPIIKALRKARGELSGNSGELEAKDQ